MPHLPVQRQLAEKERVRKIGDHLLRREHDADGYRQIVSRTLLADVGGREVDSDASRRELQAGVAHRRAHALLRLLDGGVGQPDDIESGQSGGNVDLDLDDGALEADDCAGKYFGEHSLLYRTFMLRGTRDIARFL